MSVAGFKSPYRLHSPSKGNRVSLTSPDLGTKGCTPTLSTQFMNYHHHQEHALKASIWARLSPMIAMIFLTLFPRGIGLI